MIQPCLHCMISKATQLYTMALYHYACLHSSVAALLGSLMFCWWPYYHWVAFWQNTILDFLLASSLTSKLIQIVKSWWFCYIQPLNFHFAKFGCEDIILAYMTIFWPAFDKSCWCHMCQFKLWLDHQLTQHGLLINTNLQDQVELKIWAMISPSSMLSNIQLNYKSKYLQDSNLDS